MQVLATQLVSRKVDVVLQLELAGSTQVCPKVQLWHCPTRALVTRWCIWQCLEAGCQLGPLRLTLFLPPDDTEYFFDPISNSWGTVLSEFLFSKFKWNKTPHKNMCWAWFKRDCDTFLKPTGPSQKKWVFIQSPTGPALGQPWRGRGLVLQQHHWQLKVRQWLQLQLKEQPRNSPVVCPCCQQPSCEHPEISVFFWGWGQVVFLVAFSFENNGTRSVYVGFGWWLLRLKCWGRTCQQRGRKVRTHSWVRRVEVPQTALSKSYEAVDFRKSPSGWYQGFFRLQTMISWSSVILHSQSQSLSWCFRSRHSACFFLRLSIFPGKTEKATTPAAVRSPADAQCYWVTQSLCQCVTSTD